MKRATQRFARMLVMFGFGFVLNGCAFLLPRGETTTASKWDSYDAAKEAFDRVVPHQTLTNDLVKLGFYPGLDRNVKVLTYLDVIQRFIPNQTITKADLDPDVRLCIEAREGSQAWEVELSDIRTKRYGMPSSISPAF